jgi:hypothetical protein
MDMGSLLSEVMGLDFARLSLIVVGVALAVVALALYVVALAVRTRGR